MRPVDEVFTLQVACCAALRELALSSVFWLREGASAHRLLAPDFHEFGTSGREIGYEGTAARVAEETDPNGEPILVENMRGWLLAEGLVMLKYVSENSGRRSNRTSLWRPVEPRQWQMFHHQGTLAAP